MKNQSLFKILRNGLLDENPIFRLLLGMCPTLALSTAASNGFGMGLATTFVLVCSNVVISLLRNVIPDKVRIPSFIVIIATFVTIVDLVIKAYIPALSSSLCVFIPLIVVNCVIFARAEAFACKNPVLPSAMDDLGMGLGFTLSITLLSAVREVIGKGTVFGVQVMPEAYQPMGIVTSPAGGFIMLGLLLMVVNGLIKQFENRRVKGVTK